MDTTKEFLNNTEIGLLENANNITANLEGTLKNEEQKKAKIISIKDELSKTDIPSLKSEDEKNIYVEEIDSILENISKNIDTITSLKTTLSECTALFSDFQSTQSDSSSSLLKDKLSTYMQSSSDIELNISNSDNEIDKFIKKLSNLNTSLSSLNSDSCEKDSVDVSDNNTLIISEKENRVFLPYTLSELNSYLETFPKEYSSLKNVVDKEFVLPLDYFSKHPSLSRFREAYSLVRDREAKSVFEALKYSSNVMFKYNLNPAIISACKNVECLDHYIDCLESNSLDNFNLFKIEYRLNPLKISNTK